MNLEFQGIIIVSIIIYNNYHCIVIKPNITAVYGLVVFFVNKEAGINK